MTIVTEVSADEEKSQNFALHRRQLPFPKTRLIQDWMRQDCGQLDVSTCFQSESSTVEEKMIRRGLAEIQKRGGDMADLEKELQRLLKKNIPGNDPAWRECYLQMGTF